MDRVEFIHRTAMNDPGKNTILQSFWSEYMVLYDLIDNVEGVNPIIKSPDTISFEVFFNTESGLLKCAQSMMHTNTMTIFEEVFSIGFYQNSDKSLIVEIKQI